ncbi:MAG: FAH family protein [Rhodospirillales bacterium]|nr:FAH family protein [Rhodospirillales bacterium]
MRLMQFLTTGGARRVGLVEPNRLRLKVIRDAESIYVLAREAIAKGCNLAELATSRLGDETADYDEIERDGRLLPPMDHPDPTHFFITGTGITHLGSASARDNMHRKLSASDAAAMSDSMKMFKLGLDGGKPAAGEIGAQPEWFYKGDGSCVMPPGAPLTMPAFALTGGDEAELAGLYVVADDGTPWRVGFALANEFSDHTVERQNYLYGAHSKLRVCSIGPELLTGPLPDDIRGQSRLIRDGRPIWQDEILSGEANMCHSLRNLEHHHFKYAMFRRPGDAHCHFFGAATLSFSAGVIAREGDVFEIDVPAFGRPLRNRLARAAAETIEVRTL